MTQLYRLIIVIAMFSLGVSASATESAAKNTPDQEWVIVLDDPRPARIKGWQRSQYSARGNYDGELELKRFGNRFAKKHSMSISAQWFIESLQVYCLIVRFNKDEDATLQALLNEKAVQWLQPSNEFTLQKSEPVSSSDVKMVSPDIYNPPELLLPQHLNGEGVVVAMIDSMVDKGHPELKHADLMQTDMVRTRTNRTLAGERHGTAMAGIIVADRDSQIGVTGVAPAAELVSYRGCWESESESGANCNTLSLARALDAVSRSDAHILNLSLSGPEDRLLDQLIEKITANGTMVVASYDPSLIDKERFPKARQRVWIVEASQAQQRSPESSSTSSATSSAFSAPGAKVVAAPGGKSDFMRGHSIATAYTSGVLAVCKQIEVKLNKEFCSQLNASSEAETGVRSLQALVKLLVAQA